MIFKNLASLLIVLITFSLISCQSAERPVEEPTKESEPTVTFTTQERIVSIKNELKSAKAKLVEEGDYNCCIHPACDWCLLHEGSCECHDNLKAGNEVCPGCGLGWHNGNGVVPGVKASQVKWNITHEHTEAAHAH